VLHRILRGTGIDGLAGMAKARPFTPNIALVRPILDIKRHDVLAYLSAIGQDYRTDETNQDTQWTRNRLRNELLPLLRERYNPCVDDALTRLAMQAGEAQQVIARLAATIAADCVVSNATRSQINCEKLRDHPPNLVREVFKIAWRQSGWPEQSMGFAEWQQLADLAAGQDLRSLNLPGNIRAHRESSAIELTLQTGSCGIP
jgi:tRNA(Ile)-lysidine synthase